MTEMDLTPLMRQYREIKQRHQEAILFFRVGDFYEMFFEDAEEASALLQIVLTSRGKAKEAPIPLCGVPYHAATGYIAKLLKAGRMVALCEQIEDPKLAKGLVRREVVRVFTPGTLFDPELLPQKEANILASVYDSGSGFPAPPAGMATPKGFGLASLDLSTGEFWVTECQAEAGHRGRDMLLDELTRLAPQELIHPETLSAELQVSLAALSIPRMSPQPSDGFTLDCGVSMLKAQYGVDSCSDLGLTEQSLGIPAAGALLQYLRTTQPTARHQHLRRPQIRALDQAMQLDGVTIRNLELIKPLIEGRKSPTLLSMLDKTKTAMGGRLLRQWIIRPLIHLRPIQERQEAVAAFHSSLNLRTNVRTALEGVQDFERLNSRVALGVANPRDVLGLRNSLRSFPQLRALLAPISTPLINECLKNWDDLQDIHDLIDSTILDTAPLSTKEGGIIKPGLNEELDALRRTTQEGARWVADLEARERARTGIDSLKIKYNQVFGYYLEVTKANLGRVPSDFLRKQTLVNAERFTTEELKQLEDRITGADQKLKNLEHSLFQELRTKVFAAHARIQSMAQQIGLVDGICGLAEAAALNRYTQPTVETGGTLWISQGRHPVLEWQSPSAQFIPNDTLLDLDTHRLLLITGPNMAGKSTYLRQVALIVLMAQMGSFVPATAARIGLVDRIFTRVGASDDLAAGHSTFMVEMTETAKILASATSRSLILLDEVGRGTSTYDGLSLAWAIAEYLLDRRRVGARTLFATHYHEMTQLEDHREGIKNYTVAVQEAGGEILFLRKIQAGKADRSYGIHVAKLAGLPEEVVDRAQHILAQLEGEGQKSIASGSNREEDLPQGPQEGVSEEHPSPLPPRHQILEEVKQLDLFGMTPLEALNRLAEFKTRLEQENT